MGLKDLTVRTGAATLIAIPLGGVALPSSPVFAASCHGGSCDGQDPSAQGCGTDAITAYSTVNGVKKYASFTYQGYKVELRYSASCYAFWTRATLVDSQAASAWISNRGYSNGVEVDTWWNNEAPVTGGQSYTSMWGRRSGSQYSYGARIWGAWGAFPGKEVKWPVQ